MPPYCTNKDCHMDSGTFAALNPAFPAARLRFRQHDKGASPYDIASRTKLDEEPGIENIHHAANFYTSIHSRTYMRFCRLFY